MVKTEIRLWYFCGQTRNRRGKTTAISILGGLEGDRTLDLCDAKSDFKLFCMISNCLWYFSLGFSSFPPLFRTLISMCCAAVCGTSCGQKHSLPFAGAFRQRGRGAFFVPLAVWIVPLKAGFSKSFLHRPYLRNWGAVNKKASYLCAQAPNHPYHKSIGALFSE